MLRRRAANVAELVRFVKTVPAAKIYGVLCSHYFCRKSLSQVWTWRGKSGVRARDVCNIENVRGLIREQIAGLLLFLLFTRFATMFLSFPLILLYSNFFLSFVRDPPHRRKKKTNGMLHRYLIKAGVLH